MHLMMWINNSTVGKRPEVPLVTIRRTCKLVDSQHVNIWGIWFFLSKGWCRAAQQTYFHFNSVICHFSDSRSVRVSRKFWHMLVNLCFHISLTCGVFVGGINQTRYASVCQAVSIAHLQHSGYACFPLNSVVSSQKWTSASEREKKSCLWLSSPRLYNLWKRSKRDIERYSRSFPWLEAILHLPWWCVVLRHITYSFHLDERFWQRTFCLFI